MRNYQSRILRTQEMNRLIEFSESSISESEIFEDSFDLKLKKTSAFNTSDCRSNLLTQTSTKRPRPVSQDTGFLCVNFCIECEKKDKIITDLRLSLNNTNSQAVLTEKHLKQYDNLLKFKDKRLKEEEKNLNQIKLEIEQQKAFISNAVEGIQLEKSKIAVDLQRLADEKQEIDSQSKLLDEKKVQLEELLREYLERKSNYLSFSENHEIASTSLVENLLLKREQEIQALIDEIYSNKPENDCTRKCETQGDFYDSRSKNSLKKHGNLKKVHLELKKLKEIVQKERIDQNQTFETRMETLRTKEKKIQAEKEKIVEAQKMLNIEIKAIERIKNKLGLRRKSPAISKNSSNLSAIHRRTGSQDSLLNVNTSAPESEISKIQNCSEIEDRLRASHLKVKDLEYQLEQSEKQQQELLLRLQSLELTSQEQENNQKELSSLLLSTQKEKASLQEEVSRLAKEQEDQKINPSNCSINENRLKLRITQLENIISIEGGKLQNEIEMLKHEKTLLNEKVEKLNEENNDLLNECDFLTNEKEKFRKISESLHNHLNEIDSNSEHSESINSEIDEIKSELEEKLSQVKKKEAELQFFEERLNAEREKITHSAEYIKTLSEDMNLQKKLLEKELENLKNEKIKFGSLSKRLEEKSQVLAVKEKELFNLKNKLEEREILIHSKTTVI
jgi:hypothetical protein